ncbi:hypothetical protein [Streptomyces mobaraensis]|uniref:Helix-turn-helix domain-containing protein n=1 Tax=Streptomyces mobaraensis TaxID=35621 RepID=A0A5N5WCZ3_STRMB|nr:hypothetical protein [Streptomyces mobaraensis]KAB7850143.1 hypothetical protein FRZ00_05960 [Streptomyces mobaraensis]
MTLPEIAARYDRSLPTIKRWATEPGWPDAIAKRGRSFEYSPDAIDAWVRKHKLRPPADLEARRTYTAQELEAAGIGITASTIRAERARGRWPAPDAGEGLWYGETITDLLAKRRTHRRSTKDTK